MDAGEQCFWDFVEEMVPEKCGPELQTLEWRKASLLMEFKKMVLQKGMPPEIRKSIMEHMAEESSSQGAKKLGIPRTTHLDRIKKGYKMLRKEPRIRAIRKQYIAADSVQKEILNSYENLEARIFTILNRKRADLLSLQGKRGSYF